MRTSSNNNTQFLVSSLGRTFQLDTAGLSVDQHKENIKLGLAAGAAAWIAAVSAILRGRRGLPRNS